LTPALPFSRVDIARGVTIPNCISEALAEEIGTHIGDGHLKFVKPSRGGTEYRWIYSGHLTEDREYLLSHVASLVKKLYNIRGSIYERSAKTELSLMYGSKAVFYFKSRVLGIPIGPKHSIRVPPVVFQSEDSGIFAACLRGLFDTDGSLAFQKNWREEYADPIINLGTVSPLLADDVGVLLGLLHFQFRQNTYRSKDPNKRPLHHIWLDGPKRLEEWIAKVGFANVSKFSKYLVWKAYGYCPPRTTHLERLRMINEKCK